MIKILCFHNARERASYRYRVEQFLPYWNNYQIDLQASCISGKQYINILRYLFKFQNYDYVLLQKKILPSILIKIIASRSKLVYDFDDALYTRESRNLKLKKPVSDKVIKKLNYILKKSSLVFAGSPELARYAEILNDNVHIVPTGLGRQISKQLSPPKSGRVTIGWIGNNVNLFYLSIIDEATLHIQQKYPGTVFSLMCGTPPKELKTLWHFSEWSSSAEKSWLQSIDIGIMPLTDDPWSKGKCAFKLLQYMAYGKPVVASDVGANRTTVTHGGNGFLVGTTEEWISALEQLILNREMRVSMGRESMNIFTERFERERIQQKIAEIVHGHKKTQLQAPIEAE
jgi:glycosyltransferase involved in cell wall biosynthesis